MFPLDDSHITFQSRKFPDTVLPTMLNAVDRDAYSGWGAVVHVMYARGYHLLSHQFTDCLLQHQRHSHDTNPQRQNGLKYTSTCTNLYQRFSQRTTTFCIRYIHTDSPPLTSRDSPRVAPRPLSLAPAPPYHVELCRPSITHRFANAVCARSEVYFRSGSTHIIGSEEATHNSAQSLLHGSPEAKKEGELEVSQHSKIVGRGKYVHGFESKFMECLLVSYLLTYLQSTA